MSALEEKMEDYGHLVTNCLDKIDSKDSLIRDLSNDLLSLNNAVDSHAEDSKASKEKIS
jgi:hypothetical protein